MWRVGDVWRVRVKCGCEGDVWRVGDVWKGEGEVWMVRVTCGGWVMCGG